MKHIKNLTTIISCMLLLFLIANTTATASYAVDGVSNNAGRIGMASSSSDRVRLPCNNGGCIGMAASSGLL